MEKKIIELTKNNDGSGCLTCGAKTATIRVRIQRIKPEDNIISFHVCDECLVKMQREIEICE